MRPKQKVRDLVHQEQRTKAFIDSLNLKADDLVKEEIAAAILGKHRVTLRAWRVEEPPRGPAFTKDPQGGLRGSVRYRVGDLWSYAKRITVDPSKFVGMERAAYRLSQASVYDRLRYEAGQSLDKLDMNEVLEEDDVERVS